MSAFVVEDDVINGVVDFLASICKRDAQFRDQIMLETGCDPSRDAGRESLGEAMFKLNCHAIEQRYGDGSAADFRPLDYSYRPHQVTPMQAYKHLGCWSYQCSEGDVPETSLLYAAMEKIQNQMAQAFMQAKFPTRTFTDDQARRMVSDMPEYDKARW